MLFTVVSSIFFGYLYLKFDDEYLLDLILLPWLIWILFKMRETFNDYKRRNTLADGKYNHDMYDLRAKQNALVALYPYLSS